MPDLCRNRRQLRTTRDNRPGRKPNNHNTRVVCTCLVSIPSVELRILSRKGSGFDSRRSHLIELNFDCSRRAPDEFGHLKGKHDP